MLATHLRAVYSRRQLFELLTDFWHNHFNVHGWDFWEAPIWVHFDRDVIRANLLGNFRALLEAVAKSTAMLFYLDNWLNSNDGPNENFPREMLELGLHVATLDLGGWDTHDGQDYYLPLLGDELARGLNAFYTDLSGAGPADYTQKLTIVVMSEFGRRFAQNTDNGTDHGHGNLMMVLGGNTIGGIHGTWPGLAPGQLFEGLDLAVTTDYRSILSEILIRRLANNKLGIVFPGFTDYLPLGVVTGVDLPPDFGTVVFSDDFESGDLSAWSSTT